MRSVPATFPARAPTPMHPAPRDITLLLERSAEGDAQAATELFPLVYAELRALAGEMMRTQAGAHTLDATGLVHEAFVKIAQGTSVSLSSRSHFFRLAAKVMRQVLIDHARGKHAEKRGGDASRESLTLGLTDPSRGPTALDLLALEEALKDLAALDPRKAELVELRFFGGLTAPQVAEVLSISTPTVERDWRFVRAWLLERIGPGGSGADGELRA